MDIKLHGRIVRVRAAVARAALAGLNVYLCTTVAVICCFVVLTVTGHRYLLSVHGHVGLIAAAVAFGRVL
jgi:hypothetical protein